MRHEAGLGAALGHADLDPALGFDRQRFGHQVLALDGVRQQDEARHWLVVVELGDERFQHLFDGYRAIGLGVVRAIAPVLAGAEKEHLDAGEAAILVGGEHVRFLNPFGIDGLVGRDVGQRPQPVSKLRRAFEFQVVGGLLHHRLVHVAHVLALALQEPQRFLDQGRVVFR